jgi:Ca-activated chloride channel family protein
MTENELKRLKDLPVPAPSEGAREAAVAAALAAFEIGAVADAGAPQGNLATPRLRNTSSISEGSSKMRFRRPVAIAASFVVLALAVPFVLPLMSPRDDGVYYLVPPQRDWLGRMVRQEKVAALPEPAPPSQAGPSVSYATARSGLTKPDAQQTEQFVQDLEKARKALSERKAEASTLAVMPTPPAKSPSASATGGAVPEAKAVPCPPGRVCTLIFPKQKSIDAPQPEAIPGIALYAPTKDVQAQVADRAGRVAELRAGERSGLLPEPPQVTQEGRDRFAAAATNPVKSVASEPVSTFSIDVDSASYAFVRRALNAAQMPPKEAVRVEEMINYFPYDYPLPADRSAPFRPTVTVLPSPWNPSNKLVHIAIKGFDVAKSERPRANLVLLIDTSGSMAPEDRLPLLKNAFRMLIDTLRPDDTVGIVTYAGQTHAALEPTKVADKRKILEAIERLNAGGSTAGGAGIQEAYRMAEGAFDKAAVNRVILATDGDFNVGITDVGQLKSYIERKRETGIYLSVLGVGRGNYNDALMQALAQNGNGTAAYIDTLNEARKVLVDEVSSTLFPIAKDVKIQIELNPAVVTEYRLIGYETRLLKREDFNNDKIDAGDIGSGHTVTAIYEVTPVGSPRFVEDLRYKQPAAATPSDGKGEYGFLRINYKLPAESVSRRIELAVTPALEKAAIEQAPADVRFSIAVAAFGQLLRGEPYLKGFGYDEVIALAAGARGEDLFGYRAELLNLVRLARTARP